MALSTLLAQKVPGSHSSTGGQSLGGAPITGGGAVGEQVAKLTTKSSATSLFTEQLSNIIAFITVLGGLFFVVYFLIAGFEWLRAGSDTGAVEKAKNRMINAAIGMLVMILATAIIGIVGGVFGMDFLDPAAVFESITP